MPLPSNPSVISGFFSNIGTIALAIVGGILGLVGKRAGGVLALISGTITIVFGILTIYIIQGWEVWPYSFFSSTLEIGIGGTSHLFAGITLEAIIITTGGILILTGGSD
ncbi:MAG: hypothetical protein HWN66_01860 [Candidatus Helarchaeota archaeon]|nr:hypothetical protein [Candidatus Helarchaeota archaeon]